MRVVGKIIDKSNSRCDECNITFYPDDEVIINIDRIAQHLWATNSVVHSKCKKED